MNYKTILLLAGDFNLIPCSGIYNYLARKSLNLLETTACLLSGQNKSEVAKLRYYDSLEKFLISNVCKYKPHCKDAEKNNEYLFNWMQHLRNTQFIFTEKFNEIRLLQLFHPSQDQFNPLLENPLFLNSAYSTFLKYYLSMKGKFSGTTAQSHPFYSNFEPLYTIWGLDFIGTVDYIWYNFGAYKTTQYENHFLRVRGVLDMPEIDDLRKFLSFPPNKFFPSDHFSLGVEFEYEL